MRAQGVFIASAWRHAVGTGLNAKAAIREASCQKDAELTRMLSLLKTNPFDSPVTENQN